MKNFGEILEGELHKRGITATALGRAVDISPSGMSNYRNGRVPKADELLRIAEFLGVSMEYLLTGADRAAASVRLRDSEDPVAYTTKQKPPPRLPNPLDLDAAINALEANLGALRRFRASFDEATNIVSFSSDPATTTELPFYGWAAAGRPSDTDFHSDETMTVPGDYGRKPHYLLRVRGRSMEPDYPDGSYVVVRALAPGEYAKKGDVVITADSDGVAMKRLEYRKDGKKGDVPRKPTPHLVSINPDYPDVVPVSDCPIQGVVVEGLPVDFFEL